jgi:hypothetical protein
VSPPPPLPPSVSQPTHVLPDGGPASGISCMKHPSGDCFACVFQTPGVVALMSSTAVDRTSVVRASGGHRAEGEQLEEQQGHEHPTNSSRPGGNTMAEVLCASSLGQHILQGQSASDALRAAWCSRNEGNVGMLQHH